MTFPIVLDIVLALLVLGNAVRGWRNGVVAGALGLVGLLLGVYLALWGAPLLIEMWDGFPDSGPLRSVALIFFVMIASGLGQSILGGVGRRLRGANRVGFARFLDSLLGFVAAGVVTALLAGVLGAAVKPVVPTTWAAGMNESRVLGTLERVLPGQSQRWASRLTDELNDSGLPGAFSGLAQEPVLPAEAPDASDASSPGVTAAAASILRIRADACSLEASGSGWVVSPGRVVTNAHVIAGSTAVTVQVGGREDVLTASVVAFDPDLDLAILDVPGLAAPALERAEDMAAEAPAVVAGFPLGGPYRVEAARIRGEIQALGEDIYRGKGIRREVYALYATAQPGNSGGPLLTTDGRVAGTIFARSLVDANTAYALTDQATDTLLDGAPTFSSPVGTGACVA